MNDAERFEQIFLSQVTRPGADKLLEWLKSTERLRPAHGFTGPIRAGW